MLEFFYILFLYLISNLFSYLYYKEKEPDGEPTTIDLESIGSGP